MRFFNRVVVLTAILALCVGSLFAQSSSTGALTGVVSQDGVPLPGVTVTASSPSMQGVRTTVTNEAGGYNFGALPPGDYTVRFELTGLQTATQRVKVGVAQTTRADTALSMSAVAEAITVTAAAPAVAETNEVQSNFTGDVIEELPIGRTVLAVTALSPGVVSGVNGLSISGGQSFDNLYTVNGVVVQENLRGQPHNLFIEDAIQETTVQQAGVSAEFGNFTGGVVNAITKSGGNEFSGTLRDNLTNPAWTDESDNVYTTGAATVGGAPDPNCIGMVPGSTTTCVKQVVTAKPLDKLNNVYEGTFGGRIIRDRLWFFVSARDAERELQLAMSNGGAAYTRMAIDERKEAKLTGAITANHNLVASYLEAPASFTNGCQIGCYDWSSIDPAGSNPNDFITAFYNGVLTNNLLLEARYAKKTFAFQGYGGEDTDRVTGTVIRLVAPGYGTTVNEPYFCGSCGDEARDNDSIGAKLSYFLGTKAFGNHNIIAGYDQWHETRMSNNFQSTTDYVFIAQNFAPKRDASGNTLMSVKGSVPTGSGDYFQYWPILASSLGSDLNTDSFYVNDKWDFNARWSFNIGARMDKNDAIDSAGNAVASDSKISPRLGASFNALENGRLRLNATYGTYVGRLAETVSGYGSAAGSPARFNYRYGGPDIIDVSPEEAMRQVWAWFDQQGGIKTVAPYSQNIPGVSTQIQGSLKSPSVDEWSLGASTQIGQGFLRADYIRREWKDFYGSNTTLGNGQVTLPSGAKSDKTWVINTNEFSREYDAIQLQGSYRLWNRLNLGANYTWSELQGNYTGETSGSGPVTEGSGKESYPEYYFERSQPVGFLGSDQTHKFRAWAAIDFATFLGNFNVSLLQNFDSGTPYSYTGAVTYAGYITNPGYVLPPTSGTYFISDRGDFRFDDITATDLALNYTTNPAWLRGVGLFVQAEMLNIFNEQGMWSYSTAVNTRANGRSDLAAFNPFTTDPGSLIECPQSNTPAQCQAMGAHFQKTALFGLPTSGPSNPDRAGSFQLPLTYRFSVGLRF
ncbi:MAG: TonB-dependent receptor [Thermoanaerobaculia bacterium]